MGFRVFLLFLILLHRIKASFHDVCLDGLLELEGGYLSTHEELSLVDKVFPVFEAMEQNVQTLPFQLERVVSEVVEEKVEVLFLGKLFGKDGQSDLELHIIRMVGPDVHCLAEAVEVLSPDQLL
jgi:hypothetical protein